MGNNNTSTVLRYYNEGKIEQANQALTRDNYEDVIRIAIDTDDNKLFELACKKGEFGELYCKAIASDIEKNVFFYFKQADQTRLNETANRALLNRDLKCLKYIHAHGGKVTNKDHINKFLNECYNNIQKTIVRVALILNLMGCLVKETVLYLMIKLNWTDAIALSYFSMTDYDPNYQDGFLLDQAVIHNRPLIITVLLKRGVKVTHRILSTAKSVRDGNLFILLKATQLEQKFEAENKIDLNNVIVEPEEDVEKQCIICYKNKKNIGFFKCGHITTCKNCAETIINSTKKCPICNATIVNAIKMFSN